MTKGEKGITIIKPLKQKIKIEEEGSDPITIEGIRGFGATSVFDISQTHGKDLPNPPAVTPLDTQDALGDEIWSRVSDYVVSRGVSHYRGETGTANGFWKPAAREIWTSEKIKNDMELKTFIHETAHMEADHRGNVPRGDAEVLAEIPAYATLRYFDIDSSGYSFGYVAGWAQDGGCSPGICTKRSRSRIT